MLEKGKKYVQIVIGSHSFLLDKDRTIKSVKSTF